MVKMWASNEGFDIETARDYASKLVLLACAHLAGIFEALCASGYVHKRLDFLDNMEAWLKLPGIIKGAKPERVENVGAFMNAMASRPDEVVEEAVEHCLSRKSNAKNVLGLGDVRNLTLKKGDFTNEFVNEFAGESFDIIFIGNICHIYSEKGDRKLIKRASNILRSGGMIAIEDMVRGRSPMAEMFAVNMLANTEEGSTNTEAQYREWLTYAGFHNIEIIDLAQKSNQLILAFLG